jgi:hypothetical protein
MKMRESIRAILIFLLAATSMLLLVIGLIAPLTPSEGTPKGWELFIFAGVPIFLPCIGIAIAKKPSEKVFSVVTEIIVLSILAWWAWTIGRFL